MAHTKAKGSTKLGRDSRGQRLGVKRFGGELVNAGEVLIRQRGSKWYAGSGVKIGRDDTLYAAVSGQVRFFEKTAVAFSGVRKKKTYISVVPAGDN